MAKLPIVVANWKMYKTAHEAARFVEELLALVEGMDVKIFLAVPYTAISTVSKAAKGSSISVGAQNMNDASEGAFTGEVAALMLKEAGAEFVILGHSERRRLFHESNEFIARKVVRALKDDLIAVVCVGETDEERSAGRVEEVLREQITRCLQGIAPEFLEKVILAYEPVWAIGTGKTATAAIAEEAHVICRECLIDLFGKKDGGSMHILYGGSVKADNAKELISQKEIGGLLVGGASLKANILAQIASHCQLKKGK